MDTVQSLCSLTFQRRKEVKVPQSCLNLFDPIDCPWNSPSQNSGVGSFPLLQGIFPTQGLNLRLPHCRQILYQLLPDSLLQKTGVGSLSLLQWMFMTKESNEGLLRCRKILYQLSYEGSPTFHRRKEKIKHSIRK